MILSVIQYPLRLMDGQGLMLEHKLPNIYQRRIRLFFPMAENTLTKLWSLPLDLITEINILRDFQNFVPHLKKKRSLSTCLITR